ncbi:hypothetical protein KPH14_006189 [Odynerus spinipes]|uniref:Uncharacterized protein n=1 Tax=Odynerus spinipes TaxID=1348599 RepID=A0AAD9RJS9_9HYME|nr:hypothetical protein KPH14_006189 [Odynerus spinipes]
MAAMHYNAQVVSEELHQRHLYGIQQRLQDPGSSPRSEEARSPIEARVRSPEEIRFVATRSPDVEDRTGQAVRYPEELCAKRYSKDHGNQNFFQEAENASSRKCFTEEMLTVTGNTRCRESGTSPGRTSSPQGYTLNSPGQHNSSGKTSFCIDALLGRATGKHSESDDQDRQKIFTRNHAVQESLNLVNNIQSSERESPCSLRRTDDQRSGSLGNPLHPFVQHPRSVSPTVIESHDTQSARENFLGGIHGDANVPIPRSVNSYRNDRLENVEDDASVDVDPSRTTGSASPGSNGSRSPASSPPISPGSEEPTNNGILGHPSLPPGPYAVGTGGVVRQNQGLLLHPGGPLIHPGGLYYHPAGGSAFHSIHKEGQPVGHPQSAGPHPQQHHIHQLQLEWLARTGMLYPRLPADLAGVLFILVINEQFRNKDNNMDLDVTS